MSHKKDPCPKLRVKKIKDRFTRLGKKIAHVWQCLPCKMITLPQIDTNFSKALVVRINMQTC